MFKKITILSLLIIELAFAHQAFGFSAVRAESTRQEAVEVYVPVDSNEGVTVEEGGMERNVDPSQEVEGMEGVAGLDYFYQCVSVRICTSVRCYWRRRCW